MKSYGPEKKKKKKNYGQTDLKKKQTMLLSQE